MFPELDYISSFVVGATMQGPEKISVKLHNFDQNIKSLFSRLRHDVHFTDVTLASGDGHRIVAHKIVLVSLSPFFMKILEGDQHCHNPLIYMRGLSSDNLTSLVDFLYLGEVKIHLENLEAFLNLAEELQLSGFSTTKGFTTTNSDAETDTCSEASEFFNRGDSIITRQEESFVSRQSVIRTNNTSLIRTDVDEDMGTKDVQEEQLPGNFSQKEDDATVLPEVGQIKAEEIEVSGHEQLMSNVYNPQLEQFNEKISTPEIASTDVTKEAERLFKCKLCDSDFLDKKGLTQHHLSVHEKSKCQHCKQEFGKTNLQRHEKSCVKKIHSKKKKCPLCHKLVANSNTHLKTCKAKTIKERKRVTGSVDSDPQSFLPPTTFCPSG